MLQIRQGVFETNSSSTHSICIVKKSDFDKWKNGEMMYDSWNDKMVTREEMEEARLSDKYFDEYYYQTFEEYYNDWELEKYEEHYTSESGDELVIFGEYGYDG